MDKKGVLKESIIKLIQLGISDKEIIENLKSVGVNAETARGIIDEARHDISSSPQSQAQAARQPAPPVTRLPEPEQGEEIEIPEDIYSKADDEKGKKPVSPSQSYSPKEHSSKPLPEDSDFDGPVEKLWEKGILSTVDAKLNEMKKIRSDLDSLIDSKIQDALKVEAKKIETVMESQKSLFYAKIDAHLDSRASELKEVLESRAKQLEDLNAKVQSSLTKLQGENKFNAELLNTLNDRLSGLDTIKSQMISETNRSLIGMGSKFKEFMEDSERRRDDYEAKLNSALELQSKITEGITEELRQKIDSLRFEKEEEITKRVQGKLAEFDKMVAQVDSKGIAEKISKLKELEQQVVSKQKEMDAQFSKANDMLKKYVDSYMADVRKDFGSLKKEVSKAQAENLSELKKEYASNVDELFSENLVEWDKKMKEKKKEIDELKAKIDVEKLDTAMESLDLFKEQFLNTVKKNIDDYNRSKKELVETASAGDKAVADHLRRVDEKMKELTDFEKKFSSDVSGILSEMQGGRKAKQEKLAKRSRSES